MAQVSGFSLTSYNAELEKLKPELKAAAKKSQEEISRLIIAKIGNFPAAKSIFSRDSPEIAKLKQLNKDITSLQKKLDKTDDIQKIHQFTGELMDKISEAFKQLKQESDNKAKNELKAYKDFFQKRTLFKAYYESPLKQQIKNLRQQLFRAHTICTKRSDHEFKQITHYKLVKKDAETFNKANLGETVSTKETVKIINERGKDVSQLHSQLSKIEKLQRRLSDCVQPGKSLEDPNALRSHPLKVFQTLVEVQSELDNITKLQEVISDPAKHSELATEKEAEFIQTRDIFFKRRDLPDVLRDAKKKYFETRWQAIKAVTASFYLKYSDSPVTPIPVNITDEAQLQAWQEAAASQSLTEIPTLKEAAEFLKARAALDKLEKEFTAYQESVNALVRADKLLKNVKGKKTDKMTKVKRNLGYFKLVREQKSILKDLKKAKSLSDFQKIQERCNKLEEACKPLHIEDGDVKAVTEAIDNVVETDKLFGTVIESLIKEKNSGTGAYEQDSATTFALDHVIATLKKQAEAIKAQSHTNLANYGKSLVQLQSALQQMDKFKAFATHYKEQLNALKRDNVLNRLRGELKIRKKAVSSSPELLNEHAEHLERISKQIEVLNKLEKTAEERAKLLFDQVGKELDLGEYFTQLNDLALKLEKLYIQREEIQEPQQNKPATEKLYLEAVANYVANATQFLTEIVPPAPA